MHQRQANKVLFGCRHTIDFQSRNKHEVRVMQQPSAGCKPVALVTLGNRAILPHQDFPLFAGNAMSQKNTGVDIQVRDYGVAMAYRGFREDFLSWHEPSTLPYLTSSLNRGLVWDDRQNGEKNA